MGTCSHLVNLENLLSENWWQLKSNWQQFHYWKTWQMFFQICPNSTLFRVILYVWPFFKFKTEHQANFQHTRDHSSKILSLASRQRVLNVLPNVLRQALRRSLEQSDIKSIVPALDFSQCDIHILIFAFRNNLLTNFPKKENVLKYEIYNIVLSYKVLIIDSWKNISIVVYCRPPSPSDIISWA